MAGEFIAFSDLFDVTAFLAAEFQAWTGVKVPVQLLTNSKVLFDVISKRSRTSEKRMMLDIAAPRECFRDMFISEIGFVCSASNIMEGLIKSMQQRSLQNMMLSGRF